MDLTLPFPGAFGTPRDEREGDALRPLDWSVLLARLGAERDLRRERARNLATERPIADFGRGAALVVGGPSHNPPHDAPSVNPDALADCKSTGGNTFAAGPDRISNRTGAKLGARGQQ